MVKLVAEVAVNNQHLDELGLLDNFNDLKFKDRKISSFTAKDKDAGVNFEMSGQLFTYDPFHSNHRLLSGRVDKITVINSGDEQYSVAKLSISAGKMESYFSGSISKLMAKIFDDDDKLIGSNEADTLYGYDGNDLIKGKSGADYLRGNDGADDIRGGDGNDKIKGDKGADTLNGNDGKDTLTGGSNSDTFVFSSALDPSTNVDKITDMKPGVDTIQLSHSTFAAISTGVLSASAFYVGSAAHDGSDRIVYDDTNGRLYYTPDGNQGDQILFAKLDASLALQNTDIFVI